MRGFLVLLLVLPVPLAGQGLAFAVARYASYSAHTLYVGYRAGPVVAVGGVLHNPRSGYRESMVGIGRPLGSGTASLMLVAAVARTSDGDYGQFYLLPNVRAGRLVVDATIELQTRLRGRSDEIYVSPSTAHLTFGGWEAGLTWTLAGTFGASSSQALGPSVGVAVPGGLLGVHYLRGLGSRGDEVWLTARLSP